MLIVNIENCVQLTTLIKYSGFLALSANLGYNKPQTARRFEMKRLWAPWRIQYILQDSLKGEGCIFCTKPAQNRDEENFILFRGKHVFVIMNIFPYNTGHLMIAPYSHVGSLELLSSEEITEMFTLAQETVKILRETMDPDGFNLGINIGRVAGAGFDQHVHLHIVPRWNGDTNYMPVIADVKVIPEGLKETYNRLKPAFDRLKEEWKK